MPDIYQVVEAGVALANRGFEHVPVVPKYITLRAKYTFDHEAIIEFWFPLARSSARFKVPAHGPNPVRKCELNIKMKSNKP